MMTKPSTRWLMILAVWCLLGALAAYLAWGLRPRLTVNAQLRPNRAQAELLERQARERARAEAEATQHPLKTTDDYCWEDQHVDGTTYRVFYGRQGQVLCVINLTCDKWELLNLQARMQEM